MTDELYAQVQPLLVTSAKVIARRLYKRIGEDLIQAGALALLKTRPFDPSLANLNTWVDNFARGPMKDEMLRTLVGPKPTTRRKFNHLGLNCCRIEGPIVDDDVRPCEHAGFGDVEAAEEVGLALSRCKPIQRDAIERHYLRGERLEDIGASEGVGKSTICRRILTGFDQIRWFETVR